MSRSTLATPRALIVDDEARWHANTALQLEHVGFDIELATTILEGEERAMALLDLQESGPILIVLDLVFNDEGPLFEGSVLAHALIRRMGLGLIRRGLLVALSNALTPDREDFALHAGCDTVLPKPLKPSDANYLRTNVAQSIALPFENPHMTPPLARALRASQYFAEQALADLRDRQSLVPLRYGPHEAQLILHAVTSFELPSQVVVDAHEQRLLVAALGGAERARDRLRRYATRADEPYRSIVLLLLNGKPHREIARSPICRGAGPPFDRSHIYRCLHNLPAQVASSLQPATHAEVGIDNSTGHHRL